MALMKQTLNTLRDESALCEVFRDAMSGQSIVGTISRVGRDFLLMRTLDGIGRPDGITVFPISDVTRLRWGGRELDAYRRLDETVVSSADEIDLSSHSAVIRAVAAFYGYVGLYTEMLDPSVYFVGDIVQLDDGIVELLEYGTFKMQDRPHAMLRTSDITRIDAGSAYGEALKALYLQTSEEDPSKRSVRG